MSIIPIDPNVVNVTVSQTESGINAKNPNTVGLFTNETPTNGETYGFYLSATQVGEQYGTSSTTYDMAVNIFSQSPNILTGDGELVIMPLLSSVSATSGDFVSDDISANIANIILVSDGDLNVTLNGTSIDLTNLDFTSATDITGVATILQNSLQNAIVTNDTTTVTVTSKKVGASSTVVLGAVSGGSGTDLSGASYFNTTAGTSTAGVDSTGETLMEAIARLEGTVNFAGVITNIDIEDSTVSATASTIQSRDKIFVHHFASTEDILGIATTIKDASQTKTRCLGYFTNLEEANLMKAAYVGRAFSTNFDGTNTTQTMNLKTLANVSSDTNITQTDYNNCKTAGMDIYPSYDGLPKTLSTGGNSYFDQVYNQLAYKFDLQAAGFNYLATTSTKITQTEAGMDGLKGALNKVNEKYVTNNWIGKGLTWNSPDTFGNEQDFRRNITDRGYYTYSIPIAQQAQADRENRIAPLVQIAVKESGAIHEVLVNVLVEA